jgi:hypothetical protein
MILLVFVQIVCRWLGRSISFTEEINQQMFIWTTMRWEWRWRFGGGNCWVCNFCPAREAKEESAFWALSPGSPC